MYKKISFCLCLLIAALQSCKNKETLFTKLDHNKTNIDFKNIVLDNNERFSCLNFPYYYNGGGVAVGDFNKDGLQDIVFTGSMAKNRLYINKGNFKFEDITAKAGIAQYQGWSTGVTVGDVNGDGWLDIYICRSAWDNIAYRTNLLFINNHDLTFTEKAAEYGLNDSGYSTQASFFDYDKDGDLDMFLINQSKPEYSMGVNLNYSGLKKQSGEAEFENKLFRNDGGHFTNVTHQAGITSNALTFSLGINTADINMDGWPDIYISNDYNEEDYIYINNKNGTFTNQLKNMVDHVALYSMGCDIADYNNDMLPDICTLDMLPENNFDLKMHSSADRLDKYQQFLSYGFYPFFMRNQLQKNNGDGTFSEIAQLAGIDATDWSWSVLFADYDLDGKKDVFVTNGVKHDITNLEYMRFASDNGRRVSSGGTPISFTEFLTHIPGEITSHYFYKNAGNDQFKNVTAEYGLDEVVVSNGATYADLDNDGDLDLITNNLEEDASIYKNNSEKINPQNHFIKFQLEGTKINSLGIGSKIFVYLKNKTLYQEQVLTRGFQSSVDPGISVGLGNETQVDSVKIIWPDDSFQTIYNLKANQQVTLNQNNAKQKFDYNSIHPNLSTLFTESQSTINYRHNESFENDFNIQSLLPHFYSHNGPCMSVGDVDNDGRQDLFIGGSKGNSGKIFLQKANNQYAPINEQLFKSDNNCEDVASAFFDADNDGDLDLYIVSGGYEFDKNSQYLQDRLYINNGTKGFTLSLNALPELKQNKSCIAVCDINNDGFQDLFVGGGVLKGSYPYTTPSHIFINDGKGRFKDLTKEICPELLSMTGIVNSAVWIDINKDGKKDLVIAGEWMPVRTFVNKGKALISDSSINQSLLSGWWCSLSVADMDGDGDEDIVAGNHGLNSPLKANSNEPLEIYYSDIDKNGVVDPFLSEYVGGKPFPFAGMDDATQQVPMLRKKFYEYPTFANAQIQNIYPDETTFKSAPKMDAKELKTIYFENTGKGFIAHQLPVEAQYSPVYTACLQDLNHDGHKDILLLGNNKYNKLRIGQQDANHGIVLAGDGKGNFTYVPQNKSGLKIRNDVRSATIINNTLIIGANNDAVKMYRLN